MEKVSFRISNLIVLAVIVGFIAFVWKSMKNEPELTLEQIIVDNPKVILTGYAPKAKVELPFTAEGFAFNGTSLFISSTENLCIYSMQGEQMKKIITDGIIRDISVSDDRVYVLHHESVAVYDFSLNHIGGWDASDDNPSFCQLAVSGEKIYITDSANKLVWRYTADGAMDLQIFSRSGFVVPNDNFAITVAVDTLYCSNPGFHRVERYTLDGQPIDQFGTPGSGEGSFSGCCNPCGIAVTERGELFTSEKGIARVSAFSSKGLYLGTLLSYQQLGSDSEAPLIKSDGNILAVAHKNSVQIFSFDLTACLLGIDKCGACAIKECPLRKNLQ